jgi:hypothetical protein
MYDVLGTLYQSVNVFKKIIFKKKLTSTRMNKSNIVARYLMKIVEARDKIVAVEKRVEDSENFELDFKLLICSLISAIL